MPNLSSTYLGFDFGLKRIGLAVGQLITKTAKPLVTVTVQNNEIPWLHIDKFIKEWRPLALIVGMPFKSDGSDLSITPHVRIFIEKLIERYRLPVYHVDENLTSKEARQYLFDSGGYRALQKGAVDKVAAALILQTWMESQ